MIYFETGIDTTIETNTDCEDSNSPPTLAACEGSAHKSDGGTELTCTNILCLWQLAKARAEDVDYLPMPLSILRTTVSDNILALSNLSAIWLANIEKIHIAR